MSALLTSAASLIGEARTRRLTAGDHHGARRLLRLAELVRDEAEVAESERWHLPPVTPSGPPDATIGWLLRYDAATRRLRQLHGLALPRATGDAQRKVAA